MARVHHERRVPQRLHVGRLETGQAARAARAAADEGREGVVDGLGLGGVVVVRLGPKGAAGQGAGEECVVVLAAPVSSSRQDLGDYRAAAGGLAPDGDLGRVAAKMRDVFLSPWGGPCVVSEFPFFFLPLHSLTCFSSFPPVTPARSYFRLIFFLGEWGKHRRREGI